MNSSGRLSQSLLAWAVWDRKHTELIALLGPSMTCLLPVYTPFLLCRYRGGDSWGSASQWDTLWLAPPRVSFPLVASPAGTAWPRWACPLMFAEWLAIFFCFALCRASASWTVTKLWDPDHCVNDAEYHTLIQQEQMTLLDAFCGHGFQHRQSFFHSSFSWFSLCLVHEQSVEVGPDVSVAVWAFYDFSNEVRPWDTLACCWEVKQPTSKINLHWRRLLALPVLLNRCLGCTSTLAPRSGWF